MKLSERFAKLDPKTRWAVSFGGLIVGLGVVAAGLHEYESQHAAPSHSSQMNGLTPVQHTANAHAGHPTAAAHPTHGQSNGSTGGGRNANVHLSAQMKAEIKKQVAAATANHTGGAASSGDTDGGVTHSATPNGGNTNHSSSQVKAADKGGAQSGTPSDRSGSHGTTPSGAGHNGSAHQSATSNQPATPDQPAHPNAASPSSSSATPQTGQPQTSTGTSSPATQGNQGNQGTSVGTAQIQVMLAHAIATSATASRVMKLQQQVSSLQGEVSGLQGHVKSIDHKLSTLIKMDRQHWHPVHGTSHGSDPDQTASSSATSKAAKSSDPSATAGHGNHSSSGKQATSAAQSAGSQTHDGMASLNTPSTPSHAHSGTDAKHKSTAGQPASGQGGSASAGHPDSTHDQNEDSASNSKHEAHSNHASSTHGPVNQIDKVTLTHASGHSTAAVFTLHTAHPVKSRIVSSAHAQWSHYHNWLAVDLMHVRMKTALPNPAGVINKINYGHHKTYRRFVFWTAPGTTLSAHVSHPNGHTLRVTLDRHGQPGTHTASHHTSSHAASADHTRSAGTHASDHKPRAAARYGVRAISQSAAVLYDRQKQQLIQVTTGSSVPPLGQVESFKPTQRIVVTTKGQIHALGG